jgi:osmoprotectant transport system permease protein
MDFSYFTTHQSEVFSRVLEHIQITGLTLGIALVIAIPIGTLIARVRILYVPVLGILGAIYTIPSFAFLAFLIGYVGIGLNSALIALVAYAQFILVRNTAVGLREVDPVVLDAARGMGMNAWQRLVRVEYPLALPVILGGLRVATVATIAIATVAALDDAGGLGQLLFDGINNAQPSQIEVGAVAVSLLAVLADIILRVIDRLLPASRALRDR